MKYESPEAGEDIYPVMRGYKLRCCDCGLVHRIDFTALKVTTRHKDGSWTGRALNLRAFRVVLQVYRDNRATAATRRRKREPRDG